MTLKKRQENRIFIDTNIIVYDFFARNPQFCKEVSKNMIFSQQAITAIRKNRHFQTYIADFSIPRFASLLQAQKVPKAIVSAEIQNLIAKNAVIGLSKSLISKAIADFSQNDSIKDWEDIFQYVVSGECACLHIVTANTKDFVNFPQINLVHPQKIRYILL